MSPVASRETDGTRFSRSFEVERPLTLWLGSR